MDHAHEGPQGRVFPRGDAGTRLFVSPLLAGADKAILSVRGSASLAPAFLAVMIFTVISGRYPVPAAGYHGLFISLRAAVYCGGHVTLSRDPLFLVDPMILLGTRQLPLPLVTPLQLNPATVTFRN